MRSQYGFDLCNDGAFETKENDLILFSDFTVNKNAIDCCSVTFDHLDLHNCAVELVFLDFNFFNDSGNWCCILDQKRQNIRNTFSCDSWSWNQRNVVIRILNVPIHIGVISLHVKFCNNFLVLGVKIMLSLGLLSLQSCEWWRIIDRFPSITSVNFVQRNNEWSVSFSQELKGFKSLIL